MALTLYSHPQSGHAHRVELLLSILGVDHELIDIDIARRGNRSEAYLQLNPTGEIPVLVDGKIIITESNAILIYLARRQNRTDWLPLDPMGLAAVETWLSRAAGQLAHGIARARTIRMFGQKGDLGHAQKLGSRLLKTTDSDLVSRRYLTGDHPTICDLSLYSYAALSEEAGISLAPFPHLVSWLSRIEQLPGFVPLRRTGGFRDEGAI